MNTIGILFIFVYFILIFIVLEISVALLVITGLKVEVAHELPVQEILYIGEDDLFVGVQFDKESPHIQKKFREVVSSEEDILLLYLRRGEERMRAELK